MLVNPPLMQTEVWRKFSRTDPFDSGTLQGVDIGDGASSSQESQFDRLSDITTGFVCLWKVGKDTQLF